MSNLSLAHVQCSFFLMVLQNCTQLEYYGFMKKFIKATSLDKLAIDILTSPSKLDQEELLLRNKIYSFFFDGCLPYTTDFRLRLSAIIKLLSLPAMEFRLILLIGAPITNMESSGAGMPSFFSMDYIILEMIDYLSPYITMIENMSNVSQILGDIPKILEELLFTQDLEIPELCWREIHVFNILETITTYPEPWVLPNFAAFLLCSKNLARLAIFTRAVYGSIAEAGLTMYSCFETAIKLGQDPQLILYTAAQEVSSRCTVDTCYSIFRECITQAHQRSSEFFDNMQNRMFIFFLNSIIANRELLNETLEIEFQIVKLFKSMLDFIYS